MFKRISAFVEDAKTVGTQADLRLALADISRELGFAHFALVHHVDLRGASGAAIRIHNYPDEWEEYHDRQHLGRSDPVHRACQTAAIGFRWSDMPRMIQLTPRDLRVLDAAAGQGIGDGFTVPAHVPGELSGSCSFATARGIPMQRDKLTLAQLVGAFAFEAARRLTRAHQQRGTAMVHVSDRERECLVWVARGKSDWEIARILGISPDTVHQYVKHARVAHDVVSRSQLVAKALFFGTINFMDLFKR
jgi:LuxR family quorum-sensing system transcriptional regulator CciR